MRILTLMRHAKSGLADRGVRDFDRPLNRRGAQAARAMGREIRALGLGFDAVIASPAVRVVETVEGVAEGASRALHPTYDRRIYLAPLALLLDLVRETDDSVRRLLLVGHNPGCALLASLLAGSGDEVLRTRLAEQYPTGALAEIGFEVAHWREIEPQAGALARFIRPRDLDGAADGEED
ncbi:histidine phosphatase family protein [Sphingosinicella ginsenosidimutans]|uniref:Histidine phosphatase family protein n=1 Tax=Allosphingosinicella ginsenosidimutans TaxID=1176539 RepID=A0A5C6TTK6_9SPHN|nr:histidine phosphatase family protein [Sphingosinicella ginsenosidimutans]TXC63539.1 histidine phosphatase family protein [Sphingosinicella ginsenosidimutans]